MVTAPKDYQALLHQINNPNRRMQITKLPSDEPIYEIDLNKRTIDAPNFLSVNLDHYAETIFFKVNRYFDNVDLADMTCVISFINSNPDKKKNGFVYCPPFIDTVTDPGKIIIPWIIEGSATQFSGPITFAFQFYRLEKVYNGKTAEEYARQNPLDPYPEYTKIGTISQEKFNEKYYYLKDEGFNFYYNAKYNKDNIYYEKKANLPEGLVITYGYIYNLNTLPVKSQILHGMDKIVNENNENYVYESNFVEQIFARLTSLEKDYENKNILYWSFIED